MTESRLEEYGRSLAEGIDEALPGWVMRCVSMRLAEPLTAEVVAAAEVAGEEARAEVGAELRRLLQSDIDEQRTTPLTLLRAAVRFPTRVLRDAGVPPVEREPFKTARFPADDYDLSPATWSDVDPALNEPGIAWGAAKAFEHKRRHGAGA